MANKRLNKLIDDCAMAYGEIFHHESTLEYNVPKASEMLEILKKLFKKFDEFDYHGFKLEHEYLHVTFQTYNGYKLRRHVGITELSFTEFYFANVKEDKLTLIFKLTK